MADESAPSGTPGTAPPGPANANTLTPGQEPRSPGDTLTAGQSDPAMEAPPAMASAGRAASAPAPAAGTGATTAAPGSGSAGSAANVPVGTCQPQTSLPRALEDAPDNVLFVMDRSADMALDYQGSPRWQVSGQAIIRALTPLTATRLQVGGVFYPSAQACTLPSWLCPTAPSPSTSATCSVNAVTSADQLEFAPVATVIAAFSGSPALNQPVSGVGVPLSESVASANQVFAGRALSGKTSVVLLVNAEPSCRWDANQTASTLAAWRMQKQIDTHVIALPGTNAQSMDRFTALAVAGGQARVVAPTNPDALRSAMQAVVLGSLSQCTLQLEPPVTDVAAAHVIAGIRGVEQEIPRTSGSGEALWSISGDGTQLMLLGNACSALKAGDYDSLHVDVGCSRFPRATF